MSAVTATIQIGNGHPDRGGLRSLATVRFEESSRAALTFEGRTGNQWPKGVAVPTIIPTVENTLEDALLLISYALRVAPQINEALDHAVHHCSGREWRSRIEMYRDLTEEQRQSLYSALEEAAHSLPKMVFCLYRGSHLTKQVVRLKRFALDYEVLLPTFGRTHSRWGGLNSWNQHNLANGGARDA